METFKDIVWKFIDLINGIIPLLAAIAVAVFFMGLIRYIYQTGDAKGHGPGKDFILWGLVALLVLFSLGGILTLLKRVLLS